MRIVFAVTHPTQFEVPFYQWIQQHEPEWEWEVWYLRPQSSQTHDKEMNTSIGWGFDLFAGYRFHVVDTAQSAPVHEKLMQIDAIILNGYKHEYANLYQLVKHQNIPRFLRMDTTAIGKTPLELRLRKWRLGPVYASFTGVLTTGSLASVYASKMGVPAHKIGWFPYCAHDAWFAAPQLAEDIAAIKATHNLKDGPTIIAVCKFLPRENPLELLNAFIGLNDTTLQLILVGDGPQKAVLLQNAEAAKHLNICMPGYLPFKQLPLWYALAQVFVHPATNEPWGVSVHEALLAGNAVVCSTGVGSATDLVAIGGNGFVYKSGNTGELKACLRRALALPTTGVAASTKHKLAQWHYAAVWQQLKSFIQNTLHA